MSFSHKNNEIPISFKESQSCILPRRAPRCGKNGIKTNIREFLLSQKQNQGNGGKNDIPCLNNL
jgi:hypothetical protein